MQVKDIVALVIISSLSAIVVIMAIILLAGHGSRLIAGYNTLSEDEKEKIDATKLSKFIGGILLTIGLIVNGISIGNICNIRWLPISVPIIIVGLIVFAAIYCNTGNRFRK